MQWLIVSLAAIVQAALCACLAVLFALPTAYGLWIYSFKGSLLFIGLLYVCSIMPTKAAALAIDLCYPMHGFFAISLALLFLNIPFAIIIMHQAYTCVDQLCVDIAQQLGASRWQAYKDIVWPQLRAAALHALGIIFVVCFCCMSFYPILGTHIYHATPDTMMQQAYQIGDWSTLFLYAVLRILIIGYLGYSIASKTHASLPTHTRVAQRHTSYSIWLHSLAWPLLLLATLLFMCAPLLALWSAGIDAGLSQFLNSIIHGHADSTLGIPAWRAISNSIILAGSSGIITLIFSTLLVWLAHTHHLTIKNSITGLLLVPFVIGNVGCGILFDQFSHCHALTPWMAMLLSHVFINYPFAYHILYARCSSYEHEWTLSAQSLGASSWYAFKTLYCTFMRPACLQALCLAVSLSMTEVGAATILQGDTALTLPMAIRLYRAANNQAGVIGMTYILLACVLVIATVVTSIQAKES